MEPQTSSYEYEGLKIVLTTQDHSLSDVLEAVEYVLRGQGYSVDGHLDVVKEDE